MQKLIGIFLSVVLLLIANSVYAGPVTFNYEGIMTDTSGIFNGAGSIVTGTISWDDQLLDSNPADNNDYYANNSPTGNQIYTNSYTATLNVGTLSFSETASNPTILDAFVSLRDHSNIDSFRYRMIRNGATEDRFRLAAEDDDSTGTPDGIATGTGNLTGSMNDSLGIIDNLDLSLFNNSAGASLWVEWDSSGNKLGRIDFTLTSLSRATVPEPGALSLLLFGALGITFRNRKRIRQPV